MSALKYLKSTEWEDDQCPCCDGLGKAFHSPVEPASEIGHKKGCRLAAAIRELGGKPMMKGDFKPGFDWEISDKIGSVGANLWEKVKKP